MDNEKLIEALLNCPNGEELAIFKANQNLIDARLVQTMLDYATNLATRNYIDASERLIKIVVFNLLVTLRNANFRDLKNDFLEASALFCLGTDYQALDQLAEAKKCYQQSLNITNKLDIEVGGELKVSSLQGLGSYHTRKRELAEAEKYYQESLDIAEKILDIANNKNDDGLRNMALQKKANALEPLAGIYYNQGKLDQAWSSNEQSLTLKQQLQDQIGRGNSIRFRGSIFVVKYFIDLGYQTHWRNCLSPQTFIAGI